MKKRMIGKVYLVCIAIGVVLVLCAGYLLVSSHIATDQARQDAKVILEKTLALMPQTQNRVPEERGNNAMAAMEVDGVNVLGVLEIPQYGSTLPLASGWDTSLVLSMPCRFTGSIYDRSLIIGAVDAESQFSFASQMNMGDTIVLTDMEGGRYTYQVAAIHHAKHATLEKLQAGDYAMTIFVKDSKTSEYLLIRCQ